MIAELRGQHMSQQSRPGQAAIDRTARCWCLHDRIATRAAQLGANMADHLETGRNLFEHLGDILTQFLQCAAALRARLLLRLMYLGSRAADDQEAHAVSSRGEAGCDERRLRCAGAAHASARLASRSSSFNSSCSICRSTFSDLRPNCMRCSLAISSFRCSISWSRESSCSRAASQFFLLRSESLVRCQQDRLQRIGIQRVQVRQRCGRENHSGVCHELWLECVHSRINSCAYHTRVLRSPSRNRRFELGAANRSLPAASTTAHASVKPFRSRPSAR